VEQANSGISYLSLGGADPEKYAQAKASGTLLPSNHSSLFAPDVDPAFHTGIAAGGSRAEESAEVMGSTSDSPVSKCLPDRAD